MTWILKSGRVMPHPSVVFASIAASAMQKAYDVATIYPLDGKTFASKEPCTPEERAEVLETVAAIWLGSPSDLERSDSGDAATAEMDAVADEEDG